MISRYAAQMDIFLPDFKFADPVLARLVMRDERYPEIALEALRLMVAEKGFLEPFDPTGTDLAKRGVLVRHLVLPGHVENTLRVLDLLREEFGRWLPLSLMSQYKPTPAAQTRPPFDRHLAPENTNSPWTTPRNSASRISSSSPSPPRTISSPISKRTSRSRGIREEGR